jgi:hypothetical protein
MLMPARFTSNHLYPTSDGKPMAETDRHRQIMVDLIESLKVHFADDPNTYVSGNLLLFYDRGNKRRDVLRVKEYFLFDPYEDYLSPSMQGYRLRAGQYVAIRPQAGRLPSQQLRLHLAGTRRKRVAVVEPRRWRAFADRSGDRRSGTPTGG